MGAFAAVVGDIVRSDAYQVLFEHFPEYAVDPTSIGLNGSERQLDQGIAESLGDYAHRQTQAVKEWKLAGTPTGMLIPLYLCGYTDAVIVTVGGYAYHLSGPPNLDDPFATLVTTTLDPCPQINGNQPLAADAVPWGIIGDTNNDNRGAYSTDANGDQYTSRWVILFPNVHTAFTADELVTIRSIISKWRAESDKCLGIYVLDNGTGIFMGYPPGRTFASLGAPTATFADLASTVTFYAAE